MTRSGIAVLPGIDAFPAVISVIVAKVSVTFFIASVIPSFPFAIINNAFLLFFVDIYELVTSIGLVNAARTGLVFYIAIFSSPLRLAGAVVITHAVNATAVLTGVIDTLVCAVLLTRPACCSRWTKTGEFRSVTIVYASASMMARIAIARAAAKIAIGSNEAWWTSTVMGALLIAANATILTRIALTEISLGFTVAAHPAGFTHAIIVVVELNAFLGAESRAGIRKALVDISLASGTNETGTTLTVVTTYEKEKTFRLVVYRRALNALNMLNLSLCALDYLCTS